MREFRLCKSHWAVVRRGDHPSNGRPKRSEEDGTICNYPEVLPDHMSRKYQGHCDAGRKLWWSSQRYVLPDTTFSQLARWQIGTAKTIGLPFEPVVCAWVATGALTSEYARWPSPRLARCQCSH